MMDLELKSFNEVLQKGLDVIAKFRNELKAGRLEYTSVSGEVGDEVSKIFSDIGRFYNKGDRHMKTLLADHIAMSPTVLESFYDFLREIFKAVSSSGLEEQGTQWITFFLSCFVEWSDASQKFRCKVLHSGLLCEHMREVATLEADSDSKFVKNIVSFNLNVIFNCSQEESFSLYYERQSWGSFFLPWLSCQHLDVKWHCKFILGNLAPILEEKELSLLDLEDEELAFLVTGFEVATTSSIFKVQISSMVFTALELLHILKNLIASPRNYATVATPTLLQPLVKMVSCGLLPEQVAACSLIWKILERLPLPRPAGEELVPLMTALESLKSCGQPRLEMLSKCILMEMEGISSNPDQYVDFIEGCYASKKYEECVCICNRSDLVQSSNRVMLLRAKAMYMLFQRELLCLRKGRALMSVQVFHNRHSECYAKAKEVITLLSKNELVPTDLEASKMLDMAIEDVIRETNELCDVQVCYLCRRNLLDVSNSDELRFIAQMKQGVKKESVSPECVAVEVTPSPGVTFEGRHTQQKKKKLARSHFIPHSILKRFSNAHPLPLDKQTYVHLYHKEIKSDRLHSARELTYFMLCLSCEGIISRNGEEQFPSLFFNKIYDQSDPLKSKSMQKIEYGKWLYTFCVGLIFRNLHWHRGFFINEDEIYQLLVKCRTCLLNVDSLQNIDDKPEVYLLMNPLLASDEDMGYGYMNLVLNNTCAACLRDVSLDSGAPQQMCAHFFIIHIGVINILVKFTPAANVKISSEYLVLPDGGIYVVPPDDARKQILPVGVWTLFQLIAQDIEMRMREYPIKLDEKLNKLPSHQPSDNVKDVYGIVEGLEKDKQSVYAHEGVTPSPSPSESKKLNLLPSAFQVRPSFHPSAVLLPEGHHVLLHYTEYLPDSNRQSTLFLCVGNDSAYSNDKPYILWYYDAPGFTCKTGFFFSTVDLNATEFLPDNNPKAMLKNVQPTSLAPFVRRLPELIPKMLEVKGFYSLQSLLLRIKALRSVPSMDSKCSKKKRCWYCYHLCSTCLSNPAVFGLAKSGPGEQHFNFCSTACQEFHPEAATTSNSMLVIDCKGEKHQLAGNLAPAAPFRCAPISSSHEEVVHIFISDRDEEGYPTNTEISLCRGDGATPKGYVVFYQRTLCYQRFLEFSTAPEEPLPHLTSGDVEKMTLELNKVKLSVQNYISEAVLGLPYDIEYI